MRFVNKKIALYPDNDFSRKLYYQKENSTNSFYFLHKNSINDFQQTEVLMFDLIIYFDYLDEDAEETDEFIKKIFESAKRNSIPIYTPYYFSNHIVNPIDCIYSIKPHEVSGLSSFPLVQIVFANDCINTFDVLKSIYTMLDIYNLLPIILNYDPLFSLLDLSFVNSDRIDTIYKDNQYQKNSLNPIVFTKGPVGLGNWNEPETNTYDMYFNSLCSSQLDHDGVFLIVTSDYSVEMINELIERIDISIISIIFTDTCNCWQETYFESCLGIPTIILNNSNAQYKLLTILLNFFSNKLQLNDIEKEIFLNKKCGESYE